MPRVGIAELQDAADNRSDSGEGSKVRSGQYSLTFHAIDEMAEEGFEEEDFEQAMITGHIVHRS